LSTSPTRAKYRSARHHFGRDHQNAVTTAQLGHGPGIAGQGGHTATGSADHGFKDKTGDGFGTMGQNCRLLFRRSRRTGGFCGGALDRATGIGRRPLDRRDEGAFTGRGAFGKPRKAKGAHPVLRPLERGGNQRLLGAWPPGGPGHRPSLGKGEEDAPQAPVQIAGQTFGGKDARHEGSVSWGHRLGLVNRRINRWRGAVQFRWLSAPDTQAGSGRRHPGQEMGVRARGPT
jgi:hypothetical protein